MGRSALLVLAAFLVGCQADKPPVPEIDGQAALGYARTQVEMGPRVPGTEGHRRTAAWLDSLLRTRADTVVVQRWTHLTLRGDSLPMQNLVARFRPDATHRILFLAHWDTRPMADADTGARAKQPVPGANDGASGVAVLLAMADALDAAPPEVGVDLLFVDGEDYGDFSEDKDVLIGSRYYARNQIGPKPEYAILLDMVGATNSRFRKEGYSVTAAPALVDAVWAMAKRMGYEALFIDQTGPAITDDHIPLQQVGIRAI
ncbi:MAG: M28 family peptidase, partial [Gemmatimonadales bacterium]